jgi:hypothetical protein
VSRELATEIADTLERRFWGASITDQLRNALPGYSLDVVKAAFLGDGLPSWMPTETVDKIFDRWLTEQKGGATS